MEHVYVVMDFGVQIVNGVVMVWLVWIRQVILMIFINI